MVMAAGPAQSLERRYLLGLTAVALPLLLLVAGLAVAQFRAERAARLDAIARDAADLQSMLDAVVKSADDHVRQMRQMAEDHLSGRLVTPASPLRALLAREHWDSDGMTGNGLFLDPGKTTEDVAFGNLHGRNDLLAARGDDMREIDMALALFEPMRLAHLTAPHLRWSYYFSGRGDFLVVYPYATGRAFIQGLGLHSVDDYLAAMYAYDVYRLGVPDRNPGRTGYWTPVYLDVGGAGWMVSHAAPVYAGGVFKGMVGTDLLLDFLSVFLAERHHAPGRAWIIDDRNDLLADSAGPLVPGTPPPEPPSGRPVRLSAMLPAPLAEWLPAELLAVSATPRRFGAWEVMTQPLTQAPWRLVVVASEREITMLILARLWPYALLLSGALATLIVAQQWMQRTFIGPAIALAGRVREQSRRDDEPGPPALRVPALWQPWFAAVDEAFRSSRLFLGRMRDEQALKDAVVEAAFDSIITTDATGRVIEFSAGAEAIFGYRRADAIGRPIAELIVPLHLRERHEQGMRRYIATGERRMLGRRIEIEGLRADGSVFPVELSIAEVRLKDRRLFTAYLRDITEAKRTGETLRASEARLAAFMQHAPVGMYLKDLDGRYLMANPEMEKVFNRPVAETIGRMPEEVFGPTEAAMIRAYDRETLTRGAATISEEFLPGLDQYAWSMVIRFPIRDECGQIRHIAGFDVDITSRKQAEAEFHRQSEVIHQREKLAAFGSLLAGVAHELNNPLSVVLGRAIMLEEEAEDPAVKASLRRLTTAAERCARIVRSFLALARQKPREPKPVDVRTVLDATLEILAGGLRSAGIEILREDAPDLPEVVADEDELHQVFLNLVVNAQQALETAPGEPRRLWLRSSVGTEDGDASVRIEVADNGPGVPSVVKDRIFDPFFTTKPVGAGTGLGLSVCLGIVSAYGGTIAVDERRGGGALFTVRLPIRHAETGPAAMPVTMAGGFGGDVLVVDDEAEVAAMLGEALARDGHRIVTVPDGAAALELLRTGNFDAVLCDMRMPRLDGPGLYRALETIRPDLIGRLLLMTGDVLRASAALPPDACDRLLEKPLDPAAVRRRVRDLIERRR
jgi:PAS domain S-box-containing protein